MPQDAMRTDDRRRRPKYSGVYQYAQAADATFMSC